MPQNRKPNKQKKATNTTSKARGLKYGYRSGLEEKTSKQIEEAGLEVDYENHKISYTIPARNSTYTPDFRLPKKGGGFFYVETKGRWVTEDRHKHLLIRDQHPDIDIRFVFSNANAKLYKGSPTSYAMYCERHGFVWANKTIPDDWLHEANEEESTDE